MRHPTEGVLRRLLDEPAGVADADRGHITGCPECAEALVVMRDDAAVVEAALATDVGPDVDLVTGWRRLSTSPAQRRLRAVEPPRAGRARALLRRPAAAAVAVGVVLTGASAAAANDWLQIFRTEEIAPVSFSTADLLALPDLRAYGDFEVTGGPDLREVPDAATAEAETGLDVSPVTDLPRGVVGEPTYQVGEEVSATFTFRTERAAEAAAEAEEALPPPPPGLDGSSVRLDAGPGVAQVWASSADVPALLVGSAVAPTASSSGVRFEVVRDYLLLLPWLPDEVAAQLRAFAADASTLPLPVPDDRATTRTDEVDGVPATVVAANDGSFAAVVWVDDEVVTVVAGSLDDDEVLAVARRLR